MNSNSKKLFWSVLILLFAGGWAGCGSSSSTPPLIISVSLSPSGAHSVDQGQSLTFTATVANDSSHRGVTWALIQNGTACSPGCGAIAPNSTASGAVATYTAPAAVSANLQFNVVATSVTDATKTASGSATVVPPPALNNPASLPAALVGQPYSFQLTEAGGVPPFTWSITAGALPVGLNLNSTTGVISGTPTTASQAAVAAKIFAAAVEPNVTPASFTVQGCDSGSPKLCSSQPVSLLVNAPRPLAACSTPPQSGAPTVSAISQTPAGSITLPASANVVFSATATSGDSSALSWQWFVGEQPSLTGSTPIPGATGTGPSPSYTIPKASLTGAYNGLFYSVVVSNDVCGEASQPAVLALNQNPTGNGEIQIPTIQRQARFSLTQSGGAQFLACSGTTSIGGSNPTCSLGAPAVDWAIYENGIPCPSGCGSVVPANSPPASGTSGATTTYIAPTDLPLAGKSFTLLATNHADPTDFATTEIIVTPCSIGEPMCGDFTFLVQGFDANGKPANTAGHFTSTGLVNGSTMITGGVIDINDTDGIDAAAPIASGSYTFDTDSNGSLLPNLNSLTGTITLNITSTLPNPKSHAHRTYGFTSISFGLGTGKASLIEFEPAPQGGCPAPNANPACGFQGSGSMWQLGTPGPYAFAGGCTANPANTPPSPCNYAFGFQGSGGSGPVGMVGAFNVNVDAGNKCNVTANISPAGKPTVVRNQPGANLVPQLGSLFGSCGALSTVNVNGGASTAADDANGRGTAQLCFMCSAGTAPTDTFAYYVVPPVGLIFVDMTTSGSTLSGVAHSSVTPANPMTTLGCGTLLEVGQVANCVAYTSGSSQNNGGAGSNGTDVTLTLARFTCPTPNDGGGSCREPLPPIPNSTLTGKLAVTLDQVTGGVCNGQAVSNSQPCGASTSVAGSYIIETTTGVGYICIDPSASPCPLGATDPHAISYAHGFLLANDKTAALGSLGQQVFPCTTPCITPQTFANNPPGPFVAASIPSSQSAVPNVSGSFGLQAAASSTCAKTDNFDSDALYASGAEPVPGFLVTLPSANPSVSGCYTFDNPASPLATGRGTGTSTAPGPANFVFYGGALDASTGSLGGLHIMETDNAIPGGQALLSLTPQNPPGAITSASTNHVTFQANKAPNCNPANPLLNCVTITATGLSQLKPGVAFVSPNLCVQPKEAKTPFNCPAPAGNGFTSALPNGVTFAANMDASGNPIGTATLSGMPSADSGSNCDFVSKVCTYVFTVTSTRTIQEPNNTSFTASASQRFVLTVSQ